MDTPPSWLFCSCHTECDTCALDRWLARYDTSLYIIAYWQSILVFGYLVISHPYSTQLCYAQPDGGRLWRKYNSCHLAWWHTYKIACYRLWKLYGRTLMAHLWHHLYPGAQFHEKPKSFPSIQYHLILLHVSYPGIKDQLARVRARNDIGSSMKQVLDNWEFLFEFAIPTVLACHVHVAVCFL